MDPASARNWKLLEARHIQEGTGRVISVANQKGGVAKTTTSVNLAAALALRGHRTLVVDIDPQANATTGLGVDSIRGSSYDLLVAGESIEGLIVPTKIDGLFCVPSSQDLAGAEVELVSVMARERKLREAVEPYVDRFDFIFLDCPPSLGLLTINALVAAQDLIVPVQCEYYALEGLGQLLGNAERVRRALNTDLRIAGFLMTMYDARTKLSGQVTDEVRRNFGDLVYSTVIPRSVRLSEAPSFGEPVLTLDPSSRGSIAYRLLAAEVEVRYGVERRFSPPPPPPPAITEGQPPAQITRGVPGPSGRGFGTTTAPPVHLESVWPREPWALTTPGAEGER